MRRIRSYSRIWKVEGVLYNLGDTKLPFPVPYSFMLWTIIGFMLLLMLGGLPPLSLIDNALVKFALPFGLAFLMRKVRFDGKPPHQYLLTQLAYLTRPKHTYMGQPIKDKQKHRINADITIVRRL